MIWKAEIILEVKHHFARGLPGAQGRGLKKTILIWSKGSEIGMFDEHGSVWATDVTEVLRNGAWLQVTGQPA